MTSPPSVKEILQLYFPIRRYLFSSIRQGCSYASIDSSGTQDPPPPRRGGDGNRGSFAHVVSTGLGQSQILSRPRGWALAYPGTTPEHLTHVFSKDDE